MARVETVPYSCVYPRFLALGLHTVGLRKSFPVNWLEGRREGNQGREETKKYRDEETNEPRKDSGNEGVWH